MTEDVERAYDGHEENKEEQALISFVKKKMEADEPYRNARERRWRMLLAYADGRQWMRTVTGLERVPEYNQDDTRLPMTADMVKFAHEKFVSRQTENPPRIECVARTNDDETIDRARGAEKILTGYYEDELELPDKRNELWEAVTILGDMFRYVGWDEEAGEQGLRVPAMNEETGERQLGEGGEQVWAKDEETGEARTQASGDPVSDLVTPFEIIPSPGATSIKDLRWLIRFYPKTLSWIRKHFPKKGKYVKPEPIRFPAQGRSGGVSTEYDPKQVSETEPATDRKHDYLDMAMVMEYWEPPTDEHADGRFVVLGNTRQSVVLRDDKNPNDDREIPFVKYSDLPTPGKFWSRSRYEKSIPIQRAINSLFTDFEENVDTLKAMLVSESGAFEVDDIALGPLRKVTYKKNHREPKVITPTPISATLFQYLDRLVRILEETWAWHEPSRGIAKDPVRSGKMALSLQQADDRSLANSSRRFERAELRHYRMLISRFRQFTEVERQIRIIGSDNLPEAIAFDKERWEAVKDVKVVEGSAMPMSKDARQEQVLGWLGAGLLPDPRTGMPDIQKAIKLMGSGAPSELLLEYNRAEMQAKREVTMWLEGKQRLALLADPDPRNAGLPFTPKAIIGPYDNDAAHLKYHQSFYETTRYEELPPEMKMEHDIHMSGHIDRQLGQMKAMQEIALQSPLGGASPAGGAEQAPPAA